MDTNIEKVKNAGFTLAFLLCTLWAHAEPAYLNYFQGNFAQLISQAQSQHKPFFVNLYIEECDPCLKMEQETYNDAPLVDFAQKNFIPFQLDALSGSDGVKLTHTYGVKKFPTLLIFDDQGRLISRQTGYISPDLLLSELQTNLVAFQPDHALNTPLIYRDQTTLGDDPKLRKVHYAHEYQAYSSKKIQDTITKRGSDKSPSHKAIQSDNNLNTSYKIEQQVTLPPPPVKTHIQDVNGLEKYSIHKLNQGRYGIQIGKFNRLQDLKAETEKIARNWKKEIWVYQLRQSGKVNYCLVLGAYMSLDEAQDWHSIVKQQASNAEIVDLQQYK